MLEGWLKNKLLVIPKSPSTVARERWAGVAMEKVNLNLMSLLVRFKFRREQFKDGTNLQPV